MATEKDMLKALDKIDSVLAASRTRSKALPSAKSLCDQYKKIRTYLELVLPFIEKIPVYGSKIATAIRFLMTLADAACPIA